MKLGLKINDKTELKTQRPGRWWLLSLAGLASMFLVGQISYAQSKMRFTDTPGAQAFFAKQYDRALEEFLKLRAANPNNTLVLRYLAITLDRLGRYNEAIEIFKEAIAVAPKNVAVRYHLGVTYYNASKAQPAELEFRTVIGLAPQSQYAQYAARYLDALSQQRVQQQRAGAPKRIGIYAQGGWQYDDNALSTSNPVQQESSNRYSGYLSVEYYAHRSPNWLVSGELSGYGAWYKEDEYKALESSTYGGSLRAQRTGTMGKYPYIGSVKYDYTEVDLADGQDYSSSHGVTLGLRVNLSKNTATYGYYRYTDDDFVFEGFNPAISSRDAANHAVGVRQTWFFAQRQGQVSAEIEYEHNDADGTNFIMDGITARAGLIVPLPWDLRGELKASYREQEYDKFTGPVLRETDTKRFSAGLSRWFGRNFLARMDYSYLDEESSYSQLEYKREVFGLSISYVY